MPFTHEKFDDERIDHAGAWIEQAKDTAGELERAYLLAAAPLIKALGQNQQSKTVLDVLHDSLTDAAFEQLGEEFYDHFRERFPSYDELSSRAYRTAQEEAA